MCLQIVPQSRVLVASRRDAGPAPLRPQMERRIRRSCVSRPLRDLLPAGVARVDHPSHRALLPAHVVRLYARRRPSARLPHRTNDTSIPHH